MAMLFHFLDRAIKLIIKAIITINHNLSNYRYEYKLQITIGRKILA